MTRETCPICCRPVAAPYRRIVGGRIVEGCVAECHGEHLPRPSASAEWHDRPDARDVRERMPLGH